MGNITDKLKTIGTYFLCLAVGYLLFRVYTVTGERDQARELAGAYKTSAEQSRSTLAKLAELDGKTQKLLTIWEQQNGEIMLARSARQQAVTEEAGRNPSFAAWRGSPLPALYQPGADGSVGMLGQTGNYTDAGFHPCGSAGKPDGSPGRAGMAGQN